MKTHLRLGAIARIAGMGLLGWLLAGTAPAAVHHVPSSYSTVKAAYAASTNGDTIAIDRGLYLEVPPALFNEGRRVVFQPTNGRVILTLTNAPSNDGYLSNTPLAGTTASAYAFNYAATHSGDEPIPYFAQELSLAYGRTLWWSWPWTGAVPVSVIVNTVGSEVAALIDVYAPAPPQRVPLEFQQRNEVGFQAQPGVTYHFAVAAEGNAYGEIVINLFLPPSPSNDNFTNATVLEGRAVTVDGFSYAATREEPDEPVHTLQTAGHSIWYRWIAPTNDALGEVPVTISTAGSDFDSVLAVYTGTNLADLTPVRTNDNASAVALHSTVTFLSQPGETYHVAVDGAEQPHYPYARSYSGNVQLALDATPVNLSGFLSGALLPGQPFPLTGELAIDHYGSTLTGPLRLKIVARAGASLPAIHRRPFAVETNLWTEIVRPDGLPAGDQLRVEVSVTCPAPFTDYDTGQVFYWGLFAILEEELSGSWLGVDEAFLRYGELPAEDGGGFSLGVPRPSPLPIDSPDYTRIYRTDVGLPRELPEHLNIELFAIANLRTTNLWVTNVTWNINPPVPLVTNGFERILVLGPAEALRTFRVDGRFTFNGTTYLVAPTNFVVFRRPRVQMTRLPNELLALDVSGEPGRRAELQWSAHVPHTNWFPLATNILDSAVQTVTNIPLQDAARFFRAVDRK